MKRGTFEIPNPLIALLQNDKNMDIKRSGVNRRDHSWVSSLMRHAEKKRSWHLAVAILKHGGDLHSSMTRSTSVY